MIDFDKISKIKNKSQLNKFNIDKPIFLSNYLHHYLIMTNNLTGLKLSRFPIHKENNEGLQGFHMSAKLSNETNNYDILNYLIEEYPEYANNINYFNESFLDMLDINDKIIDLIKRNKKIKWLKLFTNIIETESYKQCYLDKVFGMGSYKFIEYVLNNIIELKDFNWREFGCQPIFELPTNKNLNTSEIIKIFEKIGVQNIFKIFDANGRTIIYHIIDSKNIELLKYVIKKDIDLDKYTAIYTLHPFIHAYINESDKTDKNKYQMSKLIWENIKDTHDFNATNKYNENLAFVIINYRLLSGSGDNAIEKEVLEKNTIWNKQNIEKENLFELIINLSFEKYHTMINKKTQINLLLKNKDNMYILDVASKKWKEFLKSLPQIDQDNCKEERYVNIEKYKFANSNTFSSTIFDAGIFFIHLDKKYKNLYIPKYIDKTDENLSWENGFEFPDEYLKKYNNFPWVIYWKDKYNFHIHPHLNQLINSNKNNPKFDSACILLSVLLPHGGLHAMLLYYDFKNNFIERFDPYGNTYDMDIDIDNILEEELTWNTGFSYINVKKYLPVAGFQNLSDENNRMYQKPGDFGGYCLAWCLWYLELRLKNFKYGAKELVKKAISKLLSTEKNMIIFIRNYANTIDKFRFTHLKKAGIEKEKLSNKLFSNSDILKISDYVIKHTTIK